MNTGARGHGRRGSRQVGHAALVTGLCLPLLVITGWPSVAKAPGATWCYRDVCHRVRTVGETQRLVGKTMVLEASFYDEPRLDRFNKGKHTSNGEVFDANNPARVAAANFPDGTELLLRNPANGRTSHVRVNDFGPFLRSRLLDVTKRVAQDLDFARHGVTSLEVTVIAAPPPEEVVYRKNRVSLPTRGHLGALEPDAAAGMARTLIAEAQTAGPTVAATVPQSDRSVISGAGLLAGYDILGRVRAILGLPRAQTGSELEREVLAADTTLPDAVRRSDPASGKLAQLTGQVGGGEADGTKARPVATVHPIELSEAPRTAEAAAPAAPAQAPVAMPVPPLPSLKEALARVDLPAPTLPVAPPTLAARQEPDDVAPARASDVLLAAQTGAVDSPLQAALMAETAAPDALAFASDLADRVLDLASEATGKLAGSFQMSAKSMLLTIIAMLSTALLLTGRYGRATRAVAPDTVTRPALRLAPLRSRPQAEPIVTAPTLVTPGPQPEAKPEVRGSQIGSGVTVTGNVTSRGTLVVAGTVRGRVAADTLIVLDGGRIESDGPIEARSIRCAGTITGPVTTTELHLAPTAVLRGAVAVTSISMEIGATLDADVSRRPATG